MPIEGLLRAKPGNSPTPAPAGGNFRTISAGALSKLLVMPETAGSQHIDYRISMYQPMAYVKVHRHKRQEQVYHVIEGKDLMHIDGEDHAVRKHDVIFLPPGVEHSISNYPAI